VEAKARLTRGVFGQIAAGRNNIFWPADPAERRHRARLEEPIRELDALQVGARAEIAPPLHLGAPGVQHRRIGGERVVPEQ
jgi:hypothetical protein